MLLVSNSVVKVDERATWIHASHFRNAPPLEDHRMATEDVTEDGGQQEQLLEKHGTHSGGQDLEKEALCSFVS